MIALLTRIQEHQLICHDEAFPSEAKERPLGGAVTCLARLCAELSRKKVKLLGPRVGP